MKRLSIEEAYLWAQRFAAREWRLLLPVALAFFAMLPLAIELLTPASLMAQLVTAAENPVPGQSAPPALLGAAVWLVPLGFGVIVLNLWGGLTISALGVLPGVSVREAIGRAFARLHLLFGMALLVAAGLLVLAILLSMLLIASGMPMLDQRNLVVGLLLGVGLFVWVRLLPVSPLIVERRIGLIAAMRLAWEMTQGAFWRLLGGLAVYLVGGFVVLVALRYALGSILLLAGRLLGSPEVGAALDAVMFRVGGAVFSCGMYLLIVAFYRQLSGPSRGI